VVTAGILGLPQQDGYTTESVRSAHALRPSEATALALAETGVQASVVRLSPSVHDKGDKGFVPFLIQQARQHGVSAYPGDGNNRWPAVHRLDAARLFRRALEKAATGTCYHGVAEEGIPVREIAELIGRQLQLPVASLEGEAAARHFEWMTTFIGFNSPSTSLQTQEQLGWQPVHTGLLEDMALHYF
jgi:nucleoside-diphosphate-sugar epimerase